MLIIIVAGFLGYMIITPYYNFLTKTLQISPFSLLISDSNLETVDNKINILVMGIGGGSHDGPNLTDSMMIIHYDFNTNTISTLGIPRDIWSDTLKYKINTAYAIGEAKKKGGGLKLAKAELGAVAGVPIEYGAVISFNTFKELIDKVGGIDVNVERAFSDHEYPIDGKENDTCGGDPDYKCRYETISFQKGTQHMDGTIALKYTRSRHAEGIEGSDFARGRRQQLVIAGLKEKLTAILKAHDLEQLSDIYAIVNKNIDRDITNQQAAVIAKNIVMKKNFKQVNVAFPRDYFVVPTNDKYDGQYVLIPPDEDYSDFHSYINCKFTKGDLSECDNILPKSE